MYTPLVSIIIPVYNGSNYLAEAIESALSQTYQNIEIIVVNDGSTDGGATALVAAKYMDKIRYFEKENGGSSSAINVGIQKMRGEWFSWLSHDDLYSPKKIQTQIDYMLQLGVSEGDLCNHVFFSASDFIDESGRIISKSDYKKACKYHQEIECIRGNEYLVAQPRKLNFHGCSCLIHKNVFSSVGPFDESLRILNDVDMWFRVYAGGYTLHYLPEALVMGRIHAKQVSRSIGFSANHPEGDILWPKRLAWLQNYHPHNYDVFLLLGKNAYLSARTKDGDAAFAIARQLRPQTASKLFLYRSVYVLSSSVRTLLKHLYIKMRL